MAATLKPASIAGGILLLLLLRSSIWSWQSFSSILFVDVDECRGKRLYIHQLPHEFNRHVVERACSDRTALSWMCDRLANNGFGLPARALTNSTASSSHPSDGEALDLGQFPEMASLASSCRLLPASSWYRTGQFALEIMIHERFRKYHCLTDDPDIADLFYIPYYAGLDVSQYLFTSQVQMRDKLGQRLLGFLQGNRHWKRRHGRDHVLVLGRIVWDFRRGEEDDHQSWGSSLLSSQELGNATKLLIERDVWKPSQMAIPYPTGFHPGSRQDMSQWLELVNASSRDVLVSFAGALRDGNDSSGASMRRMLRRQCEEQRDGSLCLVVRCEMINCEENPEVVTCVASRSTFCLMPPGDSPTRKGLFDSLVAGCIPVVFSEHSAHTQYLWHLPRDPSSYSVLLPQSSVMDGSVDVIQELAAIPAARVRSMQDTIAGIIPRIVYAKSSAADYADAFDVALHHLTAV